MGWSNSSLDHTELLTASRKQKSSMVPCSHCSQPAVIKEVHVQSDCVAAFVHCSLRAKSGYFYANLVFSGWLVCFFGCWESLVLLKRGLFSVCRWSADKPAGGAAAAEERPALRHPSV